MKIHTTPELGVNDLYGTIVAIHKTDGDSVTKNELVIEIETSKTIIDVYCQEPGIIRHDLKIGDKVKSGNPLYATTETFNQFDLKDIYKSKDSKKPKLEQVVTAKAKIFAEKHGLNLELLSHLPVVKIADVQTLLGKYQNDDNEISDLVYDTSAMHRSRVLVIGAGRGAAQVLDILMRDNSIRVIGLVDDDQGLTGKSVMGFPVLGTTSEINKLFDSGLFDSAIISISTNLNIRRKLFDDCRDIGIPFVNAIDPTVIVHSNVKIGVGNILIAGSRVGTCTVISDNNFFSAYANIEHHNVVGSHNTFGPAVVFSSRVVVEDNCKFGTGIFVEPGVKISASCVISSGSVLRANLNANSIVKTKYMQQITVLDKSE